MFIFGEERGKNSPEEGQEATEKGRPSELPQEPGRKAEGETLQEREEGDALQQWSRQSPLQQTLSAGLHGPPQLKKEERKQHLGRFRERIIKALTLDQVEEKGVYPEIRESIQDPRAAEVVISKRAHLSKARDYILLARRHRLDFTTVESSEFEGDLGLIVVAREAVEEEEIMIPTPEEKLLKLGIPESLAFARGSKICPHCFELIREKAPSWLSDYRPFNWWDRLTGRECPGFHSPE